MFSESVSTLLLPLLLRPPLLLLPHRQLVYTSHIHSDKSRFSIWVSRGSRGRTAGAKFRSFFERKRTPSFEEHTKTEKKNLTISHRPGGTILSKHTKLKPPKTKHKKNTGIGTTDVSLPNPKRCRLLVLTDSSSEMWVFSRLRISFRRRMAPWICLAAFSLSRLRFLSHARVCFCGNDSTTSNRTTQKQKSVCEADGTWSSLCFFRTTKQSVAGGPSA